MLIDLDEQTTDQISLLDCRAIRDGVGEGDAEFYDIGTALLHGQQN